MIVTNLEQMETIVSSRKDLSWDGWNVVKQSTSSNAMYSVDGEFKGGKWMKKKVFPLTETGWNISIVAGKHDAQLEK